MVSPAKCHVKQVSDHIEKNVSVFSDFVQSSPFFSHKNITDYTVLVIDETNNQLLVGSRDSLFRLGLDDLSELEYASVAPPPWVQDSCRVVNNQVNAVRTFCRKVVYTGCYSRRSL